MLYLHRNIALSGKIARGLIKDICTKLSARVVTCACLMMAAMPALGISATEAAAETRSLKLYYIHTKEKAVITFKRNGKYDQKGLQELNRFLRDWRRNQPTKMDPRLFDLVWEVYRRSGGSDYINVVSAFRSPETNGMLRSRTKGVAKSSQHTLGKAMDFYIPGVKLARLREIAMQMQIGGVGFYPTSGSPFVHLDVGNVRAWPRMSRQELVRIFPNGNTIHLPADGKPLPGYDQALADYKKRVSSSSIQVASTAGSGPASSSSGGKRKTLLATLFGGGDEDEDAEGIAATPEPAARPAAPAPAAVAEEPEEAPVAVASAEALPGVTAPLPTARPAFRGQDGQNGLATALYSPARNAAQDALQAATTPTPTAAPAEQQFADLAQYSIPVPTLLGPRRMKGDADGSMMTAALASEEMPGDALAAHVPVPANRPAVAEALLASANSDVEGQDDEAEGATLSPVVVAALEQSGQDARSSLKATAMPSAAQFPASAGLASAYQPAVKPVETAKASPSASSSTGEAYGDAFDVKPRASNALSAGLPTKGARPSKRDAAVAEKAMVSGGRLTQEAISDWALSQDKGASGRAVKAPRVINNRMLSHDLSASAATTSFRPGAAAIDSSRFSTPVKMP